MDEMQRIRNEIAQLGAVFDPGILQVTRALFRAPVAAQAWAKRPMVADLTYGAHERNRLDVFPADSANAPLLLFVHGGGFIGGDKGNDPPFYANVGRYFAQAGFCAITINYRLAQTHGWPAGAEDVAQVLSWAHANAQSHGGDASNICLLGQSAGASHCASYLFDPRIDPSHRNSVRAAALMSGFYLAQSPLAGGLVQYFGPDKASWADRSPATHVTSAHAPLLLSVAEFDPPEVADQTYILARALNRADGQPPRLLWLEKENHVSTIHGLGLGGDHVGQALTRFFLDQIRR